MGPHGPPWAPMAPMGPHGAPRGSQGAPLYSSLIFCQSTTVARPYLTGRTHMVLHGTLALLPGRRGPRP